MKQPAMKPNKPWKDRKKKQIAEGKRTDAEIETDNEEEIARWERKKEENNGHDGISSNAYRAK